MDVKDRFYEIDLLRFLAALAVVLYHYTFRGFAEGGYSPVEYPILGEIFKYGFYGVQLFFIISGFVILMTASKRDAPNFVISRITRLYPAFWVCVTLTAGFILWKGGEIFQIGLVQYLLNLTMISGFAGVEMVDGVYWTLLVEIKFYALIFVLLVFGQIKRIEWFLAFWLILTAVSMVVTLPKIVTFLFLTGWSPFFIAGALFYLVKQNGMNLVRGAMLVGSLLLSLWQNLNEIKHLAVVYKSDFSPYISSAVILVCFAVFLLVSLGRAKGLSSQKLIKLGVLTYPLYLIHQNIGFMLFQEFGDSVNRYVLLLALVSLMLVSSWLIHRLVEQPLGLWMNIKLKQLWGRFGRADQAIKPVKPIV